jgi:hypothetical protein
MAQLQGQFNDERTARQAVERLRAMDIPDEDIAVSKEGKGDEAYVLVTADVADWQISAAQAVMNVVDWGGAIPAGGEEPAVPAPAEIAREDLSDEAGGGAIGAVAGGLAGAAVAGPVGAIAGAAIGAASGAAAADAVPEVDDDSVAYSGRERAGTPSSVLGARTDEGATVDPDVAAMAGPGVIGHGALGGPAALTAQAAAVGSAHEMLEENFDTDDPNNQGDGTTSVSPR